MAEISYQHSNPASVQAKLIRWVMRWSGLKKKMERNILFNHFEKDPAIPSRSLQRRFSIRNSELHGRRIWSVSEPKCTSDAVILFLHGGAYMANINRQHWGFTGELIRKTGATVIVPDYPLAPEATFVETYGFLDQLYTALLEEYHDRRIIFAGDSAGGGLELGFIQHLNNTNRKLPEQTILFSPWLDLTMSDPNLKTFAEEDNILTIRGLKSAAVKYAGDTDLHDFRLSPIFGNFSGLCKISVFTGKKDLLHADALQFREMMVQQKIPISFFEYPEMFHDWVIITSLSESKHAIEMVKGLVMQQGQRMR